MAIKQKFGYVFTKMFIANNTLTDFLLFWYRETDQHIAEVLQTAARAWSRRVTEA